MNGRSPRNTPRPPPRCRRRRSCAPTSAAARDPRACHRRVRRTGMARIAGDDHRVRTARDGWDTTLLGASTSPLRLNQYLQDLGPEAVAVSCSVLGALPSARRFIEASTASGVPILVGGPAFGPDGLRARALGATAWAPTASAAVAAMDKLPAVVSAVPPLAVDVADELGALDVNQRALVERLSAQWSLTHLAETERGRVTREFAAEAVRQVLHAVSAALLTGDPRPVAETAAWICELLRTRGVSVNFTDELGELLVAGAWRLSAGAGDRGAPLPHDGLRSYSGGAGSALAATRLGRKTIGDEVIWNRTDADVCSLRSRSMRAIVLLAHSAELDQSATVHALGLGWTTTPTPVPQHALHHLRRGELVRARQDLPDSRRTRRR